MPRYDFRCANGHVVEAEVPRETFEVSCGTCPHPALRELAVPNLAALGGSAPAPRDQRPLKMGTFEEAAAEVDYQWSKLENDAGRPLRRPSYAGIAEQKAQDALAGKIAPPEGWTDPLTP